MFKLKKKHLIILGFLFIAFMLIGMNKVEATSVTVTTYDELKEAVNGHNDNITDTSITEVKLGADIAIPASAGMGIYVVNDFTFDLNGYTLDTTNSNSNMTINSFFKSIICCYCYSRCIYFCNTYSKKTYKSKCHYFEIY